MLRSFPLANFIMGHMHNGTSPLLLLALVFVLTSQIQFLLSAKAYSNVSCIDSERKALLKIKEGLIDDSNRLSSWMGEDCCTWEGVGCNNQTGHVVKLDLHNPIRPYDDANSPTYDTINGRLGGQINLSILDLVQLSYLDLSFNDFSETEIPAFLGSLKNMRYLNLSGAGFSGEIPHHLGNLSNLEYLDLGESPDEQFSTFLNYLSAKNLEWISGLSSLKSLNLSGVDLNEAQDWLYSANKLPSLSSLSLRFCTLPIITFPSLPYINNLTSLSSLDLGSINLKSTFPLWLFNLTKLVNLQLDLNYLYGTIPDEFEKFTSLAVLNFSSNKFSSSIPTSLCTQTSLIRLNLKMNRIQGSIPFCIGNLTYLTELDLGYNNDINGTIPSDIGNLKQLTSLYLNSNDLQGSLPSSFGQLTNLKILFLSRNQLSGTVSSTFGQLTKLQHLEISHNLFTGVLSEFMFEKLKELKVLSISSNYFLTFNVSSHWIPPFQLQEIKMDSILIGAQFPPWLQTQKNVDFLSMKNASISGSIPDWFETVYSRVQHLDLSENNLSGRMPEFKEANSTDRWIVLPSNKFLGSLKPIPSDIVALDLSYNILSGPILLFDANRTNSSLEFLNLGDNHFTGNIPSYLCSISSLQVISLANNQLTGRIPQCLGSLQQLKVLNLANNSLFGQIPSTFGGLESLLLLHLNRNKLYGELPLSLQSLTDLVTLDLGENQLQGTIPEWIGKELLNLQFLRLQLNNFSGDIPINLCQLSLLQVLNLAENKLSGHIPPCFQNFSMMMSNNGSTDFSSYTLYKDALSFTMKGIQLEYTSNLKYLKSILLSGNNIVGEIPNELMDLDGLQSLNLSNNHLNGRIPDKIGNLKHLESLDLALNQLSGPIPPSLANIDTLSFLNLSFNNLSGSIPLGDHFQTLNNQSIYEGNSGLCGKPLSKSCPDDTPSKGKGHTSDQKVKDKFEFSWFYAGIGPGFVVGLFGVFCILFFNKSWRNAYFQLLEDVYDRVLLEIAVKTSQLQRKFSKMLISIVAYRK